MHAAIRDDGTAPCTRLALRAGLLQRALARLLSVPVALLVLAEIVVLLAGVVFRYVLHHPLVWSDELASLLFLWLAMLGAAVAFERGEHMRMTAVVSRLRPSTRAFLDVMATCAALAFLLVVLPHAWEYAVEEAMITTPALEIRNAWRVAAMASGFGAMALFAVLHLLQVGRLRQVALALALTAALVAVMVALRPLWSQLGNLNLVVFFVGVVAAAVFAGVPIAFAFGLATLGYVALTTSTPVLIVVGRMDEGMSHLILLSVPLFVFLGQLIEMTGMPRPWSAFSPA